MTCCVARLCILYSLHFTLHMLQAQFILYQLNSQSWNTQGFTFNFNGLSSVCLLYHCKHAMIWPCLFRRELDNGILPWCIWRSFGMGGKCPLLQPKWRYSSVHNGLIFTGLLQHLRSFSSRSQCRSYTDICGWSWYSCASCVEQWTYQASCYRCVFWLMPYKAWISAKQPTW